MSKTTVLSIPFDDVSLEEAADSAVTLIEERRSAIAVTPNAEILLAARRDIQLRQILQRADLAVADGVGVILASRVLGQPLVHRIPGIDLASAVMEKLAGKGESVYLLGAKKGVGEQAAKRLQMRYPGLRIAGVRDGYFNTDDAATLRHEINTACPALLLVCLGSPRQEKWLDENAGSLHFGLGIGLGGALDVFSGYKRRAPVIVQRVGLEWLYRLLCEPRRIGRIARLPLLFLAAAKIRYGGKRA